MSKGSSSSSGGIGIVGATTLVFVVLKLTGVIGWSWWWVLSPLWIVATPVLLALGVLLYLGWPGSSRRLR